MCIYIYIYNYPSRLENKWEFEEEKSYPRTCQTDEV